MIVHFWSIDGSAGSVTEQVNSVEEGVKALLNLTLEGVDRDGVAQRNVPLE